MTLCSYQPHKTIVCVAGRQTGVGGVRHRSGTSLFFTGRRRYGGIDDVQRGKLAEPLTFFLQISDSVCEGEKHRGPLRVVVIMWSLCPSQLGLAAPGRAYLWAPSPNLGRLHWSSNQRCESNSSRTALEITPDAPCLYSVLHCTGYIHASKLTSM